MERSLALFAIGLIFGGGIGFVVAAGNGITLDGHDHGDPAAHHSPAISANAVAGQNTGHAGHDHEELLSVAEGPGAPTLDISLTPDPSSGWNLHIETGNFRFAPEHASTAHVAGEGHAHVYVNGEKIARQYGSWLHLPSLPEGEAVVEVILNSNDHRTLAVAGKPLRASVTVDPR
ncbi:hypothetical protein [Roseibium salinum]|uniref:PEGA domain-containing protein n=1 Tax=Roseibium salinum TaxID=1604349 RepID=A0ABT3QX27_9HYPH|nr:hypothetical protein [Roseibium sp. DSM 29163]MCX2721472.1 hypothetical protein [Roseibium sp. DSM 29163]MDN3721951.1 hypothetical protein [Roseibium salinum]